MGMAQRLKNCYQTFIDMEPLSKAFVVTLPLLLLGFLVYHWQMFLCCLVLLLPALRLAMWWLEQGHTVVPLDYLIQSFAKGFYILLFLGTGLGITAWLFASLIIFNLFEAMFGDESYLGWFWLAELLRWATFCFVEELWKALFVRWDRLKRQEEVGVMTRAHAISGVALSLGYATSQSLVFVLLVTAILENNGDAHAQKTHEITGGEFGLMVFFSLFFGVVTMPLNIMGTYLTGIAINEAGEDSGECCCVGGFGCNFDRCGFPPKGQQGIRAFLWLLRWPVLLRTLLISQFIIWIVVWGFVVGSWLLVFSFHILSVACLYVGAYCIVKRAGGTQSAEDDVYRSVYGFQLLDDDGNAPLPHHVEAEMMESGGSGGIQRRSNDSGIEDGYSGMLSSDTGMSDSNNVTSTPSMPSKESVLARFANRGLPNTNQSDVGSVSIQVANSTPSSESSLSSSIITSSKNPLVMVPVDSSSSSSLSSSLMSPSNPSSLDTVSNDHDGTMDSKFSAIFDSTIGKTAANLRAQHSIHDTNNSNSTVAKEGKERASNDTDEEDQDEEEVEIYLGEKPTTHWP